MKRLAVTAFLLLAGLGARVDAGSLPQPMSLVQRHKTSNVSHFVAGATQKLPGAASLVSRERDRTARLSHAVRGK
jgi:hypothetical protein